MPWNNRTELVPEAVVAFNLNAGLTCTTGSPKTLTSSFVKMCVGPYWRSSGMRKLRGGAWVGHRAEVNRDVIECDAQGIKCRQARERYERNFGEVGTYVSEPYPMASQTWKCVTIIGAKVNACDRCEGQRVLFTSMNRRFATQQNFCYKSWQVLGNKMRVNFFVRVRTCPK